MIHKCIVFLRRPVLKPSGDERGMAGHVRLYNSVSDRDQFLQLTAIDDVLIASFKDL
jgi:hypothetical protein